MSLIDIRIGKQSLDNILAVVKGSLDSEIVHIGIKHTSHLRLLNRANLALGEKDEHRDILLATETIDSGRTSITGGCADDGQVVTVLASLSLVLAHKEVFEEVTQTLEGDVLESERWAVEELQQVQVLLGVQRGDGGALGVTECRVGLVDDGLEVLGGDFGGGDIPVIVILLGMALMAMRKRAWSTYSDIIRWANSAKDKSRHSDSHEEGRDGISSGMNRPPSEARPFITTSSKER